MADHGLHTLAPSKGATQDRKRKGRGPASGMGKRASRGQKGQNARSGGGVRPGFEGGQMPLQRRVPKLRGTHKMSMPVGPFRTRTQAVNVRWLNRFDEGSTVDMEALKQIGLIRNRKDPVKIIGNADLTVKLTVIADGFSAGARDIITKVGGEAKDASESKQ